MTGGGRDRPRPPDSAPTATPSPAPTDFRDRLEIGITEQNPALLAPGGPPAFERRRRDLAAIAPAYYRLVVDWAGITAPDGTGIDLARPQSGCMRDKRPCAPYAGVRAQLRALAAAQRAHRGRFTGMVVFTGTPAALAAREDGCERQGTQPRSRPPARRGLPAYRAVVRAVLDEARRAGADVPYWSPWNEPNHPYFLSPQHDRCDDLDATAAARPYAALADQMRSVLGDAPGRQVLVLGETAGLFARRATTTSVPQFIRHLPADLACGAGVYGQHGYVGDVDPVGPVIRALERFRCPQPPPIWITETGVKAASAAACRQVHRRLVRWYGDPRVQAVFQYSLREDDRFPTGLVSTDLRRTRPVLQEWLAWGARPDPTTPPPPVSCSARRAARAPAT